MVELTGIYKRGILSLLKKCQVAEDTIDLKSEWDSSLTYEEAKQHIIEVLKQMGKWQEEVRKTAKEVKEEVERFTKEAIELEEKQMREQLEKQLEEIKASSVDTKEFYGSLPKLVDMVVQGYSNSLFIIGGTGTGKTTTINQMLPENAVRIGGHLTPLKLYSTLYKYSQNYILFFDDVEKVLNPFSLSYQLNLFILIFYKQFHR